MFIVCQYFICVGELGVGESKDVGQCIRISEILLRKHRFLELSYYIKKTLQ